MSGPKDDPARGVRAPAFAGMFYPDDPTACAAEAKSYLAPWMREAEDQSRRSEGREGSRRNAEEDVVGHTRWIGGVVPHAGWICSGAIAGQTIGTIAASRRNQPLLSGLPHRPDIARAAGPTNVTANAEASRVKWRQPD